MDWRDTFIELDDKQLFVRIWDAENSGLSPIILFHDSLGCVDCGD